MKMKTGKTKMQPIPPIELQAFEPGEMWSTGIISIGKVYYPITMDKVLRYLMLYQILNRTAMAAAKHMKRWVAIMGIPTVLKSDRGPAFTAGYFGEFCQDLGVRNVLTSAYHPQSNGRAE